MNNAKYPMKTLTIEIWQPPKWFCDMGANCNICGKEIKLNEKFLYIEECAEQTEHIICIDCLHKTLKEGQIEIK